MLCGRLRRRVTLQRATETRDSYGEPDPTWTDVVTRWAEVLPQEGREFFAARQVNGEVTHLVRMRYVAGVTPKDRLLMDGRVIEILASMDIEERKRELLISGKEVV